MKHDEIIEELLAQDRVILAREHEALVLPGHSETGIRQHRDHADLTSAPAPGLVYE